MDLVDLVGHIIRIVHRRFHRTDEDNGQCAEAAEEIAKLVAPRWRNQPPTDDELKDPAIIGWLYRLPGDRPHLCAPMRLRGATADGLSRWAGKLSGFAIRSDGARTDLVVFNEDGLWCPIYAPEEP